MRDEDEIRDEAKIILGLMPLKKILNKEPGQIKTFNQLRV